MTVHRQFLSVHDSHCCPTHGCKYGDEDCPVVLGHEPGINCEMCEWDAQDPAFQENKQLRENYAILLANYNDLVNRIETARATNDLSVLDSIPETPSPDLVDAYIREKLSSLVVTLNNAQSIIRTLNTGTKALPYSTATTLKELARAVTYLKP